MLAIELEKRATEIGGYVADPNLKRAESLWADIRAEYGYKADGKRPIVTGEGNPKFVAECGITIPSGSESGYCTNDETCRRVCVVGESARGRWESIRLARLVRAILLQRDPGAFLAIVRRDLAREAGAGRSAFRPNANSDIRWEIVAPELADYAAAVGMAQYDYTKRRARVGFVQPNYRTTYSATRATREATVRSIIGRGDTVTMVFPTVGKGNVPTVWRGIPVINGDVTDNRFTDPRGVIVGLSAKGLLTPYALAGAAHPLLSELDARDARTAPRGVAWL